jgi:sugar phosphate isomerase/epimerase
MKSLSLAHLTTLEVAPPAYFSLAAEAGYQSVGLRLNPAMPGGIAYPLENVKAANIARQQLADAGIQVFDVEFVSITPDTRAADYLGLFQAAAVLGAKRLNVSGDDANFERLATRFGELCDLARQFDMGVDLEFMRWREIGTIEQAVDIVSRAGRSNGRILVDALHLFRSGGSVAALAAVPSDLLGCVQLCDAPLAAPDKLSTADEARTKRYAPGEGELPLLDLLDVLPPDIPVAVEVPTTLSAPHLSPLERARHAFDATQHELKRHAARKNA